MEIIKDDKVFLENFNQLTKLIHMKAKLPEQVFTANFIGYLFFEYDRILFDYFGDFLTYLLKSHGETSATWITIEPHPVEYFEHLYKHYASAIIYADDAKKQYMDFLTYTADGNSAEALIRRPKP